MPDFGKRPSGGESLDAIAYTDQLLDAFATEQRVQPGDAGDAALFSLLENWRDDVRFPSSAHVITERDATVALHEGLSARPTKRGGHRSLTIVASLAAAVLCVGGFGAVVGTAGPGDPLYGMRTALFGEGKEVRDDRVALASKAEMEQVQQLISQGDWEQAQQKLQAVSTQVQAVDDVGTKTDLIQQWNELSVKVGTRDPEATLPPVEPGAPSFEPPAGVTLLELPPVVTTTPPLSEISTPPSDTTTSTTSETAPTSETSTTAPTSETSTTAPTSETPTSTAPTSTGVEAPAPVTSTPPPPATATTTSAAPAAEAPPTTTAVTTTTAAATTTSVPTTTTSVPLSQAPQVVTTTTAPPAAASVIEAPASTSVVVATTTTVAPRAAEVSAAPSAAEAVPHHAPEVVTTTVPQPVIPQLLPAEG
ncbi:hypothetical protein BH09ACT7_BH09ACT7_21630 [soil metagenome]